jgi:ferrous iron transport protein B
MSADQVKSSIRPAVALVGSPNCGKTTLFNWLTGSKFKTVNYAGSTVDYFRGHTLPLYGESVAVIDTPGVYSLQPHGRDEEVTRDLLCRGQEVAAVVLVIDGTQLNRQLYLVRQIQELELPMVVVVTMMDIVKSSGRRLDLDKLSELIEAPVLPVDGRLGGGVQDVVEQARALLAGAVARPLAPLAWDHARIEKEVAVAESWARAVVDQVPGRASLDHLRRWDKYLLHPFWGIVAFVLIMGTLFSSIFWLASPLMDGVDFIFAQLASAVQSGFGDNAVSDFIANGVVSGFGSVFVFVPQIFILFVGFSLLEDTGYLARAATIVDRPLHKLGLSGRAFVPILSGFACAVPAIMASRNIRSRRERWITVFIIPFMTCSARLPVYVLLLTFLFRGSESWKAGLAMTAFYLSGLVLGVLSAALLNRILKREADSHFLMELPIYRWPKVGFTLRLGVRRTFAYIKRAGPTIFVFVLLLWLGTHFPHQPGEDASQQLAGSYIGRVGRAIEPVFEPMALDWRVGLGMMSAFVAREVFVSSLAVIFNIADNDPNSLQSSLLEKMYSAQTAAGTPLFTTASVCGLIVFFMIALQCLSTTGVTWREMGSWKYAVTQLVVLNVFAYLAAVAVVQLLQTF